MVSTDDNSTEPAIGFRGIFVFVIIELSSQRVVQLSVSRHPTQHRVAQQLRDATPFGRAPHFLIRDNDAKYGASFEVIAAGVGIEVVRTPFGTATANTRCELLNHFHPGWSFRPAQKQLEMG